MPPDPCDIVMRSSLTFGRRRRARSMRSSTCCSRSARAGRPGRGRDRCGWPPARGVRRPRVRGVRRPVLAAFGVLVLAQRVGDPVLPGGHGLLQLYGLRHPLAGHPAVVVVRGAGAFRGHHAGADRRLRGAGGAEHLALPGFEHALEHLAALARLGIGDPHAGHAEQQLGVEVRVGLPHLERGVGDEPEAAPLEVGPQLHGLADGLQRDQVAVPGHHPGVLVLHLAAALGQLQHEHVDGLEDVQWLEPGHDHRLAVARWR